MTPVQKNGALTIVGYRKSLGVGDGLELTMVLERRWYGVGNGSRAEDGLELAIVVVLERAWNWY